MDILIHPGFLIKSPEASVVLDNEASTDYKGEPQSYNLSVLLMGQLDVDSKNQMKLLLFADSDFISNSYLVYQIQLQTLAQ